ncbi:MAG: hypothetical protein R3D67_20450 [Hyphomicrobiaceae bacterium]
MAHTAADDGLEASEIDGVVDVGEGGGGGTAGALAVQIGQHLLERVGL